MCCLWTLLFTFETFGTIKLIDIGMDAHTNTHFICFTGFQKLKKCWFSTQTNLNRLKLPQTELQTEPNWDILTVIRRFGSVWFCLDRRFGSVWFFPNRKIPVWFEKWSKPTQTEPFSPLVMCRVCEEVRVKFCLVMNTLCVSENKFFFPTRTDLCLECLWFLWVDSYVIRFDCV